MKRKTTNTNNIRKFLIVGLIALLLLIVNTTSFEAKIVNQENNNEKVEYFESFNSHRSIFYVGGNGTENYTKIQDAIDNASTGDTVFVYNDSSPYYENVRIDISISLIGENIQNTVIDGGGHGDVIHISADQVVVRGFTIINGNNGIRIWYASNNNITNNNLSNNGCGVMLLDSSDNTIFGNIIFNCGYGIYSYWVSNENIITYNQISNSEYGIILVDSSYLAMFGNIISNNSYGIYFHSTTKILLSGNIISSNMYGITLCNSREINLAYNNISNNDYGVYSFCSIYSNIITVNNIQNNGYGIYLDRYSNDNTITLNTILDNNYGITIAFTGSKNTINRNNIKNNSLGLYIWESGNNNLGNLENKNTLKTGDINIIYHNNFKNNIQDAYDECLNEWDDGYVYGGNYWHINLSANIELDGTYNKPHNIPGGDNQDFYPLIHPFELYYVLTLKIPEEVGEGTDLNVIVKSQGGTAIPDAIVEFGGIERITDINGIASFKSPQVKEDTYFTINVTKEDYTSDSQIVLVKNLRETKFTIILGKITNIESEGDLTTFEAVNVRYVTFLPLTVYHNNSNEIITTSKYYFGVMQPEFIFAITLIYLYPK